MHYSGVCVCILPTFGFCNKCVATFSNEHHSKRTHTYIYIPSIAFFVFIHNKHTISQQSESEKSIHLNERHTQRKREREGGEGANVVSAYVIHALSRSVSVSSARSRSFNSSLIYINNSIAALYNILIHNWTLFGVVVDYRFYQKRYCERFGRAGRKAGECLHSAMAITDRFGGWKPTANTKHAPPYSS